MLLVINLMGCATSSPPSIIDCPAPPLTPSVSLPKPPTLYSQSALIDIQSWRKRLTNTLTTP
jgi:hypothetical protein